MVLTDELKQDVYPAATLEGDIANSASAAYVENQYYSINSNAIVNNPASLPNTYANNNGNPPYNNNPNSNTTATSAKMYKLNGQSGDKAGLGITLKVMTGDNIDIRGKSFWHNNGTIANNYPITNNILDFLTTFAGTSAVNSAGHSGVTGTLLNNTPTTTSGLNSWLSNVPSPANKPKAYINWVLFDEQFKPVTTGGGSGFDGVDIADQIKSHINSVNITKNGFLYVYCSNESNQDVFFDNLQVTHTKGPLVEETHYYPFGLTMAGISSKAAGTLENKRGFQGKKMQNKEFSDGSGLELYDFGAREQDPQIGRWWTIDPKAEKYLSSSPYNFVDNNPISRIDPTGKDWFYYQAKGEDKASWHWQKGHKATYTNADGKKTTTKTGYQYLITFTYDKGHTLGGAPRGTLTLYNQNKVAQTSTAFSGAGWWTGNYDQAAPGNYMTNLSSRSVMPKVNNSSDKDNTNPPANAGMQKIEEGTVIKYPDGSTHDVNSDYGNYRIRLAPTDGSRDRGLYLHGKNAVMTARTHGCVCEKDQKVLGYIWEHTEITGKVPFAVGQTINTPSSDQ